MRPSRILVAAFCLAACERGPITEPATVDEPARAAPAIDAPAVKPEPQAVPPQDPPQDPAPAAATCGTLSPFGLCGAAFGITKAELVAAFPAAITPSDVADGDPICHELSLTDTAQPLTFLIVDDRFQRVDVESPAWRTSEGFGVGSSFAQIEARFPHARRQSNTYNFPIEDLVIDFGSGRRAIFEQYGDDIVSRFRYGLEGPVDYAEGCT